MSAPVIPAEEAARAVDGGRAREQRERFEAERQARETARVQAELDARRAEDRERNLARQRRLTPGDMDRIEAEAEARLEQLREHRRRLAPEALSDRLAAERLTAVEAEIGALEVTLARVPLARAEAAHRREQAERDEAARRPQLLKAAKLKRERVKAAQAVDQAAAAYAEALRRWDRLTTEQESLLHPLGFAPASVRPRSWMIESGLLAALRAAGMPDGAVRVESRRGPEPVLRAGRLRPLAELDAGLGAVEVPTRAARSKPAPRS